MLATVTVLSLVTLVTAAALNDPTHADGSRVTRGRRTPWGDVAALFGYTY
jgi:hypothetical protein